MKLSCGASWKRRKSRSSSATPTSFRCTSSVSSATSTERVEVFGSPGHMPPEQIRGERLTPATDVFAVGALLLEAWTGRPPFRRASFEASAEALKEPLPSLVAEHPELEPIAE